MSQRKRLNWIDWAKAIAITLVIFGHIPQERGSFLVNYIVQFHMPLFFFISGYLTKKEILSQRTLNKYWHTLIIPYFIYNILFYPYWAIRYVIDQPNTEWFGFFKPIIGTFMLQLETKYFESLNGVTWFIAALFVMKIILSWCNNLKHRKGIIIVLILIDSVFYIFNEFYKFYLDVPIVGFTRCLPFFFLGHLCSRRKIIPLMPQKNDGIAGCIYLIISLFTYNFCKVHYSILTYGITYWIICLSAIWWFIALCRFLDRFHSSIILNISIGTIVILGFHWILIGTTNFFIEKIFSLRDSIVYPWYMALALAVTFVALHYPFIIFFKAKLPFMLGKSNLH